MGSMEKSKGKQAHLWDQELPKAIRTRPIADRIVLTGARTATRAQRRDVSGSTAYPEQTTLVLRVEPYLRCGDLGSMFKFTQARKSVLMT
jgi:hypothetical protein